MNSYQTEPLEPSQALFRSAGCLVSAASPSASIDGDEYDDEGFFLYIILVRSTKAKMERNEEREKDTNKQINKHKKQ